MMFKLVVPPFGELREIKVLTWHKKTSEQVAAGELLVELEMEKAVVEVRPERAAFLRHVAVDAGEWHVLGTPLALLATSLEEPFGVEGAAETAAATFEPI
jgi:pyruvate/2-oxoglutarate dehydrogenase complex dihydrolipoamide acyltransferase (E2) component